MAGWDRRERKLFLARDAFGSENLFFHQGNRFIAFASSLKALLALPEVIKEPDLARPAIDATKTMKRPFLTNTHGQFRAVFGPKSQ
jgi:asparagine synthase (glutamine-hydrolysing)